MPSAITKFDAMGVRPVYNSDGDVVLSTHKENRIFDSYPDAEAYGIEKIEMGKWSEFHIEKFWIAERTEDR